MFRQFLLTIVFSLAATNVFAQSGRVKVPETSKTPRRPPVVYVPTQTDIDIARPAPTPLPKTKNSKIDNSDDDDDDGVVISVESNLVPIPVSVLDVQNRAVTTLKLEDFSLEIDGKAAEIGELFRSDAPVSLALLFDNSSSVTTAREFEKKAAIRFLKRVMRPNRDSAALYSVSTGTRLEQPLTKNVARIIQSIETFPPAAGATALLDGIIKASEYLRESTGRRVIVIISDGEDTISDATFDDTVKAAQANNCQVYVVKTKEFENFKLNGARGGNANIRVLAAERRMQELAAQTGGTVYSPIDEPELDRAFDQISADLAQQYILSYYPENERERRGEFRTIALAVKGKQNLKVRTRKGYYVPRNLTVNR